MVQRPPSETIAALRRTLLELEQKLGPAAGSVPFEILKQIILRRIAALEFVRRLDLQIVNGLVSSSPVAADDPSVADHAA